MQTINDRSVFASTTVADYVTVLAYGSGYPVAPAIYAAGTSAGPGAVQDQTGAWFNLVLDDGANVLWFGARRDGSTDDKASFQAAIDAVNAAGGGAVRVPAGTYAIKSAIALKSNVKLQGHGPGTILKHINATAFNLLTAYQQTACVVVDMTLDGNSAQGIDGLVFNQSSKCIGQRVYCRDWWGYHFWMVDATECTFVDCVADTVRDNGFELLGADHCSVVNCKALNVTSQGFNLWAGTRHTVCVGCVAQMAEDTGDTAAIGFQIATDDVDGPLADPDSHGVVISGCTSTGGRIGVAVRGIATAAGDETTAKLCTGAIIKGCSFRDYSQYGIAIFNGVEDLTIEGNLFAPSAGAFEIISLQQAPGTARRIIITGNQSTGGARFLRAISIDDLTISGNIIRSIEAGAAIETPDNQRAAISLQECKRGQVLGNKIIDPGTPGNPAIGIYVGYAPGGDGAADCLVTDNVIADTRAGGDRGLDIGIQDDGTLGSNVIAGNLVRNAFTATYKTASSASSPVGFGAAVA